MDHISSPATGSPERFKRRLVLACWLWVATTLLVFPGTAGGTPAFLAVLAVVVIVDLAWPIAAVVVIGRALRHGWQKPAGSLWMIVGVGSLLAIAVAAWLQLGNVADGLGWSLWPLVPPAVTWLAVPIWALFVAVRHMQNGAWSRAATAALLPLVAIVAVLHGRYLGDFVRFRLERANYLAAMESARNGHAPPLDVRVDLGPPTFAYFSWGGMVFASSGVAYDETDEAGKPPEGRSATWRARQGQSELSCDAEVRPLGGHFYMVHAGC